MVGAVPSFRPGAVRASVSDLPSRAAFSPSRAGAAAHRDGARGSHSVLSGMVPAISPVPGQPEASASSAPSAAGAAVRPGRARLPAPPGGAVRPELGPSGPPGPLAPSPLPTGGDVSLSERYDVVGYSCSFPIVTVSATLHSYLCSNQASNRTHCK